jgi:sRNA-binding regulator protein Hfq
MSIPKLKDLLNERYVSKTSDTIEDVYQSAVNSLEDLSDLFKKHAPKEKLLSRTLEKQSMMIRRMITKSKSYQGIKENHREMLLVLRSYPKVKFFVSNAQKLKGSIQTFGHYQWVVLKGEKLLNRLVLVN